mgnify:FL=1
MWETNEMNRELGYWIRKEMATEWGGHAVPEWTLVPLDRFIEVSTAKYDFDILGDEDFGIQRYVDEGATHVLRCIIGSPIDLVDGSDLYLKIEGDGFELINEVDAPDYNGGDYEGAQKWIRELAEPIDA